MLRERVSESWIPKSQTQGTPSLPSRTRVKNPSSGKLKARHHRLAHQSMALGVEVSPNPMAGSFHSTPSSSLSREQSLPRKEPSGGSGAQATHPPPTTLWGARGWSFPRQRPRRRVDMKRPYRPAASANLGRSWPLGRNEESRFTATRRGQTAKAFLPASNVLSSLKTVTATPRGLACRTSSSSFILGLAVGGRVVFPPLQSVLSLPAGRVYGDIVGSPLKRSDPVLATCQSSTSHSINPGKDVKGSPSWRRVPLLPGLLDTPISGISSFARHSASSITFHSRMGASTGGIALGSLHDSVRLHTSVWGKSPPASTGFNWR